MTIVKQGTNSKLNYRLVLTLIFMGIGFYSHANDIHNHLKKETLHQHISVANISLTLITNNENDDSEKCGLGTYDNVTELLT
ncbi:hypothetical protein BCS86_07245 [Vibrio splendidus]|nr:hypothetical protein BCU61_12340 [Vibrio splendidus]PMJ29562.1 hypothetical protein BCU26_15385 [Vibrio splendidus]PMP44724.1 hypothetical protein BCS86_07245 [Vibrio splendidus]